jgi:hypothetical protein
LGERASNLQSGRATAGHGLAKWWPHGAGVRFANGDRAAVRG